MLSMNGYAMAYDMEGEGVPFVFIHQAATNRDFGIINGTHFTGSIA